MSLSGAKVPVTLAQDHDNSSSSDLAALHPTISNGHGNVGNAPTTIRIVPEDESHDHDHVQTHLDEEARLVRKIDLRLCTISGILCSLNLLDSGIISSASVTSMLSDLQLTGNRYSISIFIFTVASVCCQLPATIIMRFVGPRVFFSAVTIAFGIITICTAAITTWQQMVALRVLLGISMSGIFPGLSWLVSAWYTRKEQQLRFALLQSGEVTILATGAIVNYGLNHLDHYHSLRGWQWMYLVQGTITIFLGIITYFWMVDFPDHAEHSFRFLSLDEKALAISRINSDRRDAGEPEPFTISAIAIHFLDLKLYAFCLLFFLLNLVTTALSYFLPIILQTGMGFSTNEAIILSSPPYYYAVLPVLLSSYIGDKYRIRAPIIIFNATSLIVGFCMLGFVSQVTVRYIGTFLATGAYVSNWAALNAYQANNVVGQWKRATVAAAISACTGLGGIAGSYIVRQPEAPRYLTAIWPPSFGYPSKRRMEASHETTATQPFAHLSPRVRHISQSTIRKKWKPLPQSSQDRVRAILLSLKAKRATCSRVPPVGTRGKSRSKKSKNEVIDEDYERAVEEVTEKLLSRLPRMPFPSNASSTSTSSVTDDQFSFEATLNRISSLQSTLTMHQRSSHLLRNQIKREQRALKHDKAELTRLETAVRSSHTLRQKQERGLHPLARVMDEDEDDEHSDGDERPDSHLTERECIEKINSVAGISAHSPKYSHSDPNTTKGGGSLYLDPGPDSHPDLESLLKQLRNHLHSMENNTASMQPVLGAMSEAQAALDLFAAIRFDEQTRRKLHGLNT